MSHDLTLAQKAAWNLARTLMAPVILFQVNDEFAVLRFAAARDQSRKHDGYPVGCAARLPAPPWRTP